MEKFPQAVEITRAERSDMEAILLLQYAAYQSEAAIHGDYTIQPLTQTLDEALVEYDRGAVLKATLCGEIIGSVRARARDGTAFVGKLIVHPAHQGKGLGRLLLAAIERQFPNQRYELFTSCKSERNLRLYTSAGYTCFRQEMDAAGIEFVYLRK